MDSAKNNLVQNPPPTCHSFNSTGGELQNFCVYNASYYSLYEKSKEKYIFLSPLNITVFFEILIKLAS